MRNLLVITSVILFVLLSFSSCNKTENDSNSSNSIVTSSVSGDKTTSMSDLEKQMYDILIDNISSFNNPSSVKFISCSKSFYEGKILVVRISGTNKLGATVTNDCVMVMDTFTVYDAYDYLDYYEVGHMPAVQSTAQIKQGVFYSFEEWGDPYECEDKNIPSEYFVLYQIAKYAVPDDQKTNINIANINSALNTYKLDMGW